MKLMQDDGFLMEVKKTNHGNTYGGLAIGFGLRK